MRLTSLRLAPEHAIAVFLPHPHPHPHHIIQQPCTKAKVRQMLKGVREPSEGLFHCFLFFPRGAEGRLKLGRCVLFIVILPIR